MQKLFIIGLLVSSLTLQVFGQQSAVVIPKGVKLLEKVDRKPGTHSIPYSKYQLDNGLTVIIHEDHSDPIVHVDVTYHVGSAREEPLRSGFAHFFEHMMFQGSDHVADEEHFSIVSESGGTLNGTTNLDRTNYFETLPSNQLETALWLEADRMGFLLDAVTQQKFEVQRATVKNERGQNYDNRPYGLVGEKISQALYPQTHPYHWPTIGYLEDLDRVDVNDLKKFFLRWYGPNNATLTVAGDVDQTQVLNLVKKYYGSIARGAEVKKQVAPEVKLTADRYISYEDNIRFPLLMMTYPTVPNFHPDEAPLDVLADILGGSKSSLFYKNFEKAQLAIQANVSNPCQELAGTFRLTVLPYPGKTLAEMEKKVRETLLEFEQTGVSDDALARFKSTHESMVISGLETVSGKASQLAQYELMLGNPNQLVNELKRYNDVTKEDVMRVYNKYIKGKSAVILSVYPKGQPQLVAAADNFKYERDYSLKADLAQYEGLSYTKPTAKQDGFDRSKRPGSGPNPTINVPDFWKADLDNGLAMIGAKTDEIPKVYLRLAVRAGHRYTETAKAGIANLFASLMAERTKNYSAEDLDSELEKLGSSIDVSAGSEEIYINVSSLTKNLDRTLALLEEVLFRPDFTEEDFNRKKFEQLEEIANQVNVATTLANNQYGKVLYGEGHIMAIPSIGTTASVEALTLADVKAFYDTWFVANIANLVVVGDVDKDVLLPKLDFLKAWKKNKVVYPAEPATPAADGSKIYLVDKPGAAQSEIRMGYLFMPYDATGEYFRTYAMNFPLGGSFNSRVNLNLREDKGWTYGAFSSLGGTKHVGPYTAQAGVKKEATDSALVEFIREFKEYAEKGVSEEELLFTRNSIGQQDALKYEAGYQKTGFLSRIMTYGLDRDFTKKQNAILQSMTKAEMDALAKKHLDVKKMAIVVVGDKASIEAGLAKLPYKLEVVPTPVDVKKN
jgi:zinc protease